MTVSLILAFYKIAKQNLYVTEPFSYSFNILIIFSIIIILPLYVKYSTPLSVLLITLIRLVIACLKL